MLGMETKQLIIIAVIGIIAGFLAGRIMKGRGFGILGDLVLGLLGGVLGSWLATKFLTAEINRYIGDAAIAILGACILLWVIRLFKR